MREQRAFVKFFLLILDYLCAASYHLIKMKFGELVKNKRKKLELSLRELGKLSGVDPGWISKIENGEIPSPIIAIKLARALEEDENIFRDYVINSKLTKRKDFDKKRHVVYHSPLSADDIERILQKEIDRRRRRGQGGG
jgi:transcriptional regulator with XRE-family HTH domain